MYQFGANHQHDAESRQYDDYRIETHHGLRMAWLIDTEPQKNVYACSDHWTCLVATLTPRTIFK